MLEQGSRLDTGTIYLIDNDGNHSFMTMSDITVGKQVVIFGGPAPFSKLDTQQAREYGQLTKDIMQYVNMVYGIYLQDAFVCHQFQNKIREETDSNALVILADGDGLFASHYKLTQDLTGQGLSMRSVRWAAVINDSVIEYFARDENGEINNTSAANILDYLKNKE